MTNSRNFNQLDAADELRRIGPQFGAAVRELDRLCERLPQNLVNRMEEAIPEIAADLALIGPKLTALGQAMQAEIDGMSDVRREALERQIAERRDRAVHRLRGNGLAFGTPPGMRGEDVLLHGQICMCFKCRPDLARLDALQGDDGTDGEAA